MLAGSLDVVNQSPRAAPVCTGALSFCGIDVETVSALLGILTFGGLSTTLASIINRVATVGDEAVSDIDQRPTETSRGHQHIAGSQRFDTLLNELRTLLESAPELDDVPEPVRRVAAHA